METTIDKEVLKDALSKLFKEEPEFVKELILSAFSNSEGKVDDEFYKILQESFKRFDNTFRALA